MTKCVTCEHLKHDHCGNGCLANCDCPKFWSRKDAEREKAKCEQGEQKSIG